MKANEIKLGRKYWIKPTADLSPRPAIVFRMSQKEPRCYQCVGTDGEGFVVFAEAFVRPVEPERAES